MKKFLTASKSSRARRGGVALVTAGLIAAGSVAFGAASQAATAPNPDLAASCAPLNIVVAVDASSAVTDLKGPSKAEIGSAVSAIGTAAQAAGANIRVVSYSNTASRVNIAGSTTFAPANAAAIDQWVTDYTAPDVAAAAAPDWAALAAGVATDPGNLVIWLAGGPSTTAAGAEHDLDAVRTAGSHIVGVAVGPNLVAGSANLASFTDAVDTNSANRLTWYAGGTTQPNVVTNDIVVTDGAGASKALSSLLATLPHPKCGLSLTKDSATIQDVDGNGSDSAGDVITYSFTAKNTGEVSLSNVTVTAKDAAFADVVCAPTLDAGATKSCVAKHTVTAAEAKTRAVAGTATATATGTNASTVTSATADLAYTLGAAATSTTVAAKSAVADATLPTVQVVKTATLTKDVDKNGKANLGDTIGYTFAITNTTAAAITNVTLTDAGPNGVDLAKELTGKPIASLAAGATDKTSYSATHVVVQADVDAGAVENQATVKADGGILVLSDTGSDGALQVVTNPFATETTNVAGLIKNDSKDPTTDPTAVTVEQVGKFDLAATTTYADTNNNGSKDAGDIVTYAFTVTNTGTVTLDTVTVTDTLLTKLVCTMAKVAPGATAPCAAPAGNTYTLQATDVTAGTVKDTATAVATGGGSLKIPNATKETSFVLGATGGGTLSIGDRVWYDTNRDGIQNTGEPGLQGVTVTLTSANKPQVTATTDSLGRYQFTNLAEGSYTLAFASPSGFVPTNPGQGTDRAQDSDVSTSGTVTVTLSATPVVDSDVAGLKLTNPTIDAGYVVSTGSSFTTTTYNYTYSSTTYGYNYSGSTGSSNTYTGGNAARIGGFAVVVLGLGLVARLVARRRHAAA